MSVPQHHQSDMETIMYEYRVLDQRVSYLLYGAWMSISGMKSAFLSMQLLYGMFFLFWDYCSELLLWEIFADNFEGNSKLCKETLFHLRILLTPLVYASNTIALIILLSSKVGMYLTLPNLLYYNQSSWEWHPPPAKKKINEIKVGGDFANSVKCIKNH